MKMRNRSELCLYVIIWTRRIRMYKQIIVKDARVFLKSLRYVFLLQLR